MSGPQGDDVDGAPTGAGGAIERPLFPERGGPLLRTPHACVVHGDDAGQFYCEHAFFCAQREAVAPGSHVVENGQGERLVGFLHVPRDEAATLPGPTTSQRQRHQGTRDVVAAALRGFVDDVSGRGHEIVRVLLTGYLQWGEVKNNPSGDFVAHVENLDAAVAQAFGAHLLGSALRVDGDDRSDTWRWRLQDNRPRELEINALRLSVDDDAINGGPRSLQAAMRAFLPHVVLSTGVHKGTLWIAEHHADDGRLGERDGLLVHDDDAVARTVMADNWALPRAIQRGRAVVVVVA